MTTEVTITPIGIPDVEEVQGMFDLVLSQLAQGITPVETALEVGITELENVERVSGVLEAAKTGARKFLEKVMQHAGLTSTMTDTRTLTLVEPTETESFDSDKLKSLIADLVGNGGRDAEIAGLLAKCRKKNKRAGYLMVKARSGE